MDYKAFALTGRMCITPYNPGRCPGLGASALSGRVEHSVGYAQVKNPQQSI